MKEFLSKFSLCYYLYFHTCITIKQCIFQEIYQLIKRYHQINMEEYIRNIKISVHLDKNICNPVKSREKIMKRVKDLHIIIYIHTPNLANLTGIRTMEDIPKCIQILENLFSVKSINYEINCIMLSVKSRKIVKLQSIKDLLPQEYHFDYNPEIFSGAFLKYKIKNNYSTIIIFHTGAFQIFSKNLEMMENSYLLIESIIAQLSSG